MMIPILMYHAVADDLAPAERWYSTPVAEFEMQMGYLHRKGYRTITLSDLCQRWDAGHKLPPKTIAITFDDGYECVHRTALPIMQRYGFVGTVFVISDYIGRIADFDVDIGAAARQTLSKSQIQELLAVGFEIGSHSSTHSVLTHLTVPEIASQLRDSRAKLQDLFAVEISSLAYPKGRYNQTVKRLAEEHGYSCACSCTPGVNNERTDRLLLRRSNMGSGLNESQFNWQIKYGGPPLQLIRSAAGRMLGVGPKPDRYEPKRATNYSFTAGLSAFLAQFVDPHSIPYWI